MRVRGRPVVLPGALIGAHLIWARRLLLLDVTWGVREQLREGADAMVGALLDATWGRV
jgi:hypothetical protein